MDDATLRRWLRARGIVVHDVARRPEAADGRQVFLVFLEGTLGQFESARHLARRCPGVSTAEFSPATRAILIVESAGGIQL